MKFTEFHLAPEVLKGIEDAGFAECTSVQAETMQYSLEGIDVYVQSQTGTGKTAAFLITILDHFLRDECPFNKKALIIAPTRELAVQIEGEAKLLASHMGLTIGTFHGGVGYAGQEQLLAQGVDVAIATPGRLLDFADSRKINLKDFGFLVIDEADRLFDMGFLPDLRRILRKMGHRKERMTMLFSATLSSRVAHLAWEHMYDPQEVLIDPEQITVETVTQELYHVTRARKMELLLGILKRENPENALIFTNTKQAAYEVASRLKINRVRCEYIIGDLTQRKRLKVIDAIKSGDLKLLAATDVAARGLHINDLDIVINYDLPEYAENYVHRIGRTARAGKSGKAISLACERFVYGLEAIERLTGIKIPVVATEQSLYVRDLSAGRRFPLERVGSDRSDRSERRFGGHDRHRRPGRARRPDSTRQVESTPGPKPAPVAARQESPRERPRREHAERPRPNRGGSAEERLEYYRHKYGDDFRPAADKQG